MQPQPDPTLVNVLPPVAGGIYIAPSPTLATYPAWLLRTRKTRKAR